MRARNSATSTRQGSRREARAVLGRIGRSSPVLSFAMVALLLVSVTQSAAGDSHVQSVQTWTELEAALSGCTGTDSSPSSIQATGSIEERSTTLTIPCVVDLDLNGHDLSVQNVVIDAGERLTIQDSTGIGSLTADASANPNTAGIQTTGATLSILGGTVDAIPGQTSVSVGVFAAGIGGVSGAAGGTVTITGGTVNATNSPTGAGIGGGNGGAGGTVTITGGTVTAGNFADAAGIGGGRGGDGATVTISGGTVTASSIGGGMFGAAGTILITGGTVTATAGGRAAGIGAHRGGQGGSVTISGGTVNATGGNRGAGIGTGADTSTPLVIEISGGVVTARGGQAGAGIGGGDRQPGGTITISGGSVTAIGAGGAAGIGGGGPSNTAVGGAGGSIRIAGGSGGVVTATALSGEMDPIGPGLGGAPGDLTVDVAAVDDRGRPTRTITFPAGAAESDSSGQSASVPSDPAGESVSVAVAAAVAAGVAGTSEAVLVRDGAVVPVGSVLSAVIGPRGGVVLTAEGLRVAVASSGGAGSSSGVVVSPGDALEVSIVSALVPGSVVEAWGYSTPRLVGAVRVPDDFVLGDTLVLMVPTGAPLDGGDRIGDGAHALQLRMEATSGFEVLVTGMTVGGRVPTSVPTGDGPTAIVRPLLMVLFVLAGGLGALLGPSRSGWPALRVS